MITRIASVVGLLVSLSGCALLQTRSNLTDHLDEWFAEAKVLVETHENVDLDHVTLIVGDRRVLAQAMTKQLQATYPNFSSNSRQRQSYDLLDNMLGMYFAGDQRIYVNIDALTAHAVELDLLHDIPPREAAMSTLIHEAVHAADDANYRLLRGYQPDRHNLLPLTMVMEGSALLKTQWYCRYADCVSAANMDVAINQLPADPQDVDTVDQQFNRFLKYDRGYQFVKALHEQDAALVSQVLRQPPASVLEFFEADKFPDNKRRERTLVLLDKLQSLRVGERFDRKVVVPRYPDVSLPLDRSKRKEAVATMLGFESASAHMLYINDETPESYLSIQVILTGDPRGAEELLADFKQRYRKERQYGRLPVPDALHKSAATVGYQHKAGYRTIRSAYANGRYLYFLTTRNHPSLHREVLAELSPGTVTAAAAFD
ncbi:MAG: hypothetical protein AAF404_06950 [Pseudomonadota bacterium]